MTLDDAATIQPNLRRAGFTVEVGFRNAEGFSIQRCVAGIGERGGKALFPAPRTADALPVIGESWRNVGHHDGRHRADVHAHLHCRRAVEHVDFARLELGLEPPQARRRLLCGVFGRAGVGRERSGAVMEGRPNPFGT